MNLPEPVGAMIAATSEGICGICSEPLLSCGYCPCCNLAFMAQGGVFATLECECIAEWYRSLATWRIAEPRPRHPHAGLVRAFRCEHVRPWCARTTALLPGYDDVHESAFTVDGYWMALVYLRDAHDQFYVVWDDDLQERRPAQEWRSGRFSEEAGVQSGA